MLGRRGDDRAFGSIRGLVPVVQITHVKNMHSKWSDACSQIILFDRVGDDGDDVSNDEFCVHIVRLFMQLSAMATLTLHVDKNEISELWSVVEQRLMANDATDDQRDAWVVARRRTRRFTQRPMHADWLRRGMSRVDAYLSKAREKATLSRRSQAYAARHAQTPLSQLTPLEYTSRVLELERIMTLTEVRMLQGHGVDPVLIMAHRIGRAVTTRGRASGWPTPPPIVSRVFQELSNGLLAYNAATKIKEVPVPFAYVQFNALILNVFNVLSPLAVARFTEHVLMSILTAVLSECRPLPARISPAHCPLAYRT